MLGALLGLRGLGVWGLGLRVQGLGVGWGLELRVHVLGLGVKDLGLRFRITVWGLGYDLVLTADISQL